MLGLWLQAIDLPLKRTVHVRLADNISSQEGMDFFLLDTNFFRAATKSPGNLLMNNLVPQLHSKSEIVFSNNGETALRISPFGLLESLNIVLPKPPSPPGNISGKPFLEVYKTLIGFAESYFEKMPQLQLKFLLEQDAKERSYVDPQALPLYEACITSVLKRPIDVTRALVSYLAHDYFLKFPFKKQDLLNHMPSFCVMFFQDFSAMAPASRFRLSIRLYDSIRQKMGGVPDDPVISKAFKIKTDGDLLDTEIVQDVTFGFPFGGIRHRVVALTFDEANVVGARALFHKQVGATLATKLKTAAAADRNVARDITPFLTHPGGCVVQSNKSGDIVDFYDLSSNWLENQNKN